MFEVTSALLNFSGAFLGAYSAITYVLKPGQVSEDATQYYDGGQSRIKHKVRAASQIFTAFGLFAIASLLKLLALEKHATFLLLLSLIILAFCVYSLKILPDRLIARELDKFIKK